MNVPVKERETMEYSYGLKLCKWKVCGSAQPLNLTSRLIKCVEVALQRMWLMRQRAKHAYSNQKKHIL